MEPMKPLKPLEPMSESAPWWSGDLGRPSVSGASNGVRYAYFPDKNRLAVSDGQDVTVYDTAGQHITGFLSSDEQELKFDTEHGRKGLRSLKRA